MLEKDIQKEILAYLDSQGIWAWKNATQGGRVAGGKRVKAPVTGSPDIFGIITDSHGSHLFPAGRLLAIEVKTPTGVLSDSQKAWIEKAAKSGVICFVARSVQDVKDILHSYGIKAK